MKVAGFLGSALIQRRQFYSLYCAEMKAFSHVSWLAKKAVKALSCMSPTTGIIFVVLSSDIASLWREYFTGD